MNNWAEFLTSAVARYRRDHPNDQRSAQEIATDFMEHLVRAGVVRKVNGKYQLPKLEGDAADLCRKIASDLN